MQPAAPMSQHIRFDSDDDDEPMATTSAAQQANAPHAHCCSAARVDFDFADPCYVFKAIRNPDCSRAAASLSNNAIALFDCHPAALVAGSDVRDAHTAPITDIAFPLPACPHALYSCSRDGTVKGWDLRSKQLVETYQAPHQELFCFCFASGELLAAGAQGEVRFWDRRTRASVAIFDDMHMDDVTQVLAHEPSGRVLSASEDGLIAVHATAGGLNQDDGFEAALNVGTSVEEVGLYGATDEQLWVRTGTETLQLWEWLLATREDAPGGDVALADFADARTAVGAAAATSVSTAALFAAGEGAADYLVTCHWHAAARQLLLAAGTNNGAVALFPVSEAPDAASDGDGAASTRPGVVGPPVLALAGAHDAVVRSVSFFDGAAAANGLLCLTGGEDARVCLWTSSQHSSLAANQPEQMQSEDTPPASVNQAAPSVEAPLMPLLPSSPSAGSSGDAAPQTRLSPDSLLLAHEPIKAAVGDRPAYTDLDAAAAHQQGADVMDVYDFVMYQEGMSAGPSAVPLPSSANTAVFVPPEAASSAAASSAAASAAGGDTPRTGAADALCGGAEETATGVSACTPPPHVAAAEVEAAATAEQAAQRPASVSELLRIAPDAPPLRLPVLPEGGTVEAAAAPPAGSNDSPVTPPSSPTLPKQPVLPHQQQQQGRSLLSCMLSAVLWVALLPLRVAADLVRAAWGEVLKALRLAWYLAIWATLLVAAAPMGVLVGGLYVRNRRLKRQRWQLLSLPLNDAQLRRLLGALPAWLEDPSAVNPTERLDWLNHLVAQLWPVLDPFVCGTIASTVEPMLSQMKPPFIAAMGFKRFTLGETPVTLEGVRVTHTPNQEETISATRRPGAPAAMAAAAAPFGAADAATAPLAVQEARAVAGTPLIMATALAGTADGAGTPNLPGTNGASSPLDQRVELEVDFTWAGQPNVHFFVELALAGPYTRLVPRLSSLTVAGTLKLVLAPLLPVVPGFGAVLVSFTQTPQVKFSLEFGPALGGRYTARPVASFLDPFIRDTLANMAVWPARVVVPLLPPEVTGPLDDLQLHSVGVLAVDVIQARNLPQGDGFMGTTDPQVELWTQPQHRLRTSAKGNTTAPKWGSGDAGQRLEVMVQEPGSQRLRLVVHDIDLLNVKELFKINLLKGARDVMRSSRPIARTAIPLADICAQPHQEATRWWRLARGDWGEVEAAVEDEGLGVEDSAGEIQLRCVWRPFSDADLDPSKPLGLRGVLFVDVRAARHLPSGDAGGSSDPYAIVDVARQQHRTAVVAATTDPAWAEHAEFLNVQASDMLVLRVYDRDWLKWDDHLGELVIPLKQVMASVHVGRRGLMDRWMRLKPGKELLGGKPRDDYVGEVNLRVQYRAYD